MKYLIYYLLGINILSFIYYGIDKKMAIAKKWRISERTLFYISFLGGCLGSLIGMLVFRHKTKKIKFYIWHIIMIIMWGYLLYKYWR